jgi:adenine/guanine phosphoribosyltransferase-like PRPP-binding protein
MNVVQNKTSYDISEIISIAQRENNTKRNYVIVNYLQAKHIPVFPGYPLDLFTQLGKELYEHYCHENVTIIGFAETATAIGAAIAACFGGKTPYIHTTRENIQNCENIVDFVEEHSHATEQRLFCRYSDEFIKKAERIIFVDDEITTGKTVLNFISALSEKRVTSTNTKFAVASIVNGMDNSSADVYKTKDIACHYLIKIKYDQQNSTPVNLYDSTLKNKGTVCNKRHGIDIYPIHGKVDPRKGVTIGEYENACENLASKVIDILRNHVAPDQSVLILGTEEFMYPSVFAANRISAILNVRNIKVHATTRSPIIPYINETYPIKSRFELNSLYDNNRRTFIYNLDYYDVVAILTDAEEASEDGFICLAHELGKFGCKDILGIRWLE